MLSTSKKGYALLGGKEEADWPTSCQGCRVGLLVKPTTFEVWSFCVEWPRFVPQNRWFISWNIPLKGRMTRGTPILGYLQMMWPTRMYRPTSCFSCRFLREASRLCLSLVILCEDDTCAEVTWGLNWCPSLFAKLFKHSSLPIGLRYIMCICKPISIIGRHHLVCFSA